MLSDSIQYLCCPIDRGDLILQKINSSVNDIIMYGVLQCTVCKNNYKINNGIANLIIFGDDTEIMRAKIDEIRVRDSEASGVYDDIVGNYRTCLEWRSIKKSLGKIRDKKLLDIGCGTGRISVNLLKEGAQVMGLDYSEKSLLETLRKIGNNEEKGMEVVLADCTRLPILDNYYDKIVCSQVIEHLKTPEERLQMINEFARVLKPGGRLVLTAYNYNQRMKRILGPKKKGYSSKGVVFYCYTDNKLAQDLSKYLYLENIYCIESSLPLGFPRRLGSPVGFWMDDLIAKTRLSFKIGHLLVAVCTKR